MTLKSYDDYPKNAAGQRYGSELEAATPYDAPDLILACGDDGEEGYVLKSDLRGSEPRSPGEAIAMTEAVITSGPRLLSLFAADGKTRVGSITVY